ncbi:crystal protein [Cyprinus carpio]|uniref:Carboxylic ester hydrolase n=1 Tax=Cyprinus carpio TaxID=7962 RepID=A0A9Q9W652_CYPCA|nr:crystal protein [Cyprinus carpio]
MHVLGLFMVTSVFISTGSASDDQMELAALLRSVSSAALITGPQIAAAGPKLLTKDGLIQGLTLDKSYVFYGIPFADPPVAASRWKPPRPVTPWSGVYDATYPRAACMQACIGPIADECLKKVSEDCLYLNVFVPLSVNLAAPLLKPLPVMLWIHGGDFIAGSASKQLYDGRYISNFTQTLVVSVAYRLGAFGFLVSGKDPRTSAAGNYGILDQQAALLWVQQNIAVFGGDPSRVTLFGESAGAQSVSLHLMIQSSKPLFRQAVFQSLPFSIPLKTRHESLKLGKNFAKSANCSLLDLMCLQSLSPQEVLNAQIKSSSKVVNPFRFLEQFESWGPYVDGELIREQAVSAFLKGHWQKDKPVLLGTVSSSLTVSIKPNNKYTLVYSVHDVSAVECTIYTTAIFKQHAIKILRKNHSFLMNTLTGYKILRKYLPLYSDADRRDMLAQIVTDYIFLCPSRRSARAGVASGSSVWMYVDPGVWSPGVWSAGLTLRVSRRRAAAHLPLVSDSRTPASNLSITPSYPLLSNRMLCYWGAFAHTGDPGSHSESSAFCRQQRPPAWPRYTANSGWLNMNLTLHSHAQTGSREDICDFWDTLGIYP